MDVLADRRAALDQVPDAHGPLVVELDQDDRAVDAVVEDRVVARAADPGETGLVEVRLDLGHPHSGVALPHVVDVEPDQVEQSLPGAG